MVKAGPPGISPWRHLLALSCSAVLLGGCATAPVSSEGQRAPPEAALGREVELFAQPPLVMSVAVDEAGVAQIAAIAAGGTLLHLVVNQEGRVNRNVLGQVNQDEVFDLAVGADGAVHLLLGTRYLRFASAGVEDADAGGCERITVTPAGTLCNIPVDAAGVPLRIGVGGVYDGLGRPRLPRPTKLVIARFEERAWSTVAMLEPDSDWAIPTASVAAGRGVVHVLYVADGPVSSPPIRRVVRFATFRVPESNTRPPERVSGPDVWELVPGTEPVFIAEPVPASASSGAAALRRRYELAQPAADGPVIALTRPAGRAYTMLHPSGSGTPVLLSDASDLLLVQDGRLLRELPARSEDSGWKSFVFATRVAAAGAGRFHMVSVSKDDLLGFATRARYLQVIAERWSKPFDLGRVADRVDLVKLGAGAGSHAFVVLPATDGRVIGRWITPQR
jgi:hypothetical protein